MKKIVLIRQTNRHKWVNAGSAIDNKDWIRIVYLAQRDYTCFQSAYITVDDNFNSYDIYNLPQDAEVNILPDIFDDPVFLKNIENFMQTGVMPVTPPVVGKMMALGILA